MIIVPQSMRDQYYSTYLLATGHKPAPLSGNPDMARRTASQHVSEFITKWVELFAAQEGQWKHVPYKNWYDTWIDYGHWLESERLWQMLQEGMPNEPIE